MTRVFCIAALASLLVIGSFDSCVAHATDDSQTEGESAAVGLSKQSSASGTEEDETPRDPRGPLSQGDAVGAFYVTKVAGAEDDGVEPGEELCYRCRYGSSPMVMIFARQFDGRLPPFVKSLDAAVESYQDERLRGLVTLLGEDAAAVKQDAKKLAEETGATHVPIAIAKEPQLGPENYRIDPKVEVTIVLAKDSQVVSVHQGPAEQLDVAALLAQVQSLLQD